MENQKTVQAWHFTHSDGTTYYLKTPEIPGELYTVDGPPECCFRGFHGSRNPADALQYAEGLHVGIRELSGDFDEQTDKLCSTQSRLLTARKDARAVVVQWARDCADRVAHLNNAAANAANAAANAYAANAAAYAYAANAGRKAERDWQNTELDKRLRELLGVDAGGEPCT